MRHELYGDFRDVVKWSIARRLAGERLWISQVAMLRDNESDGEGRDYRKVPPDVAQPEVVAFFERERKAFERGAERNLTRVSCLAKLIEVHCHQYSHKSREAYFNHITDVLCARPSQRRDVVLVDPDNGLEPENPGDKHVCLTQLEALFKASASC